MDTVFKALPDTEGDAHKEVLPEHGDLIIAYLEQLGVEYVFGIPGGAIEPLYNALARSERRAGPRSITARHETGAAFMADGYASNTGKLGVCCATTGPGATNLLTGVASAFENNVPLLVITAQTALSTFGRGAFQESSCTGINTVALFANCTHYSTLVSHPAQLEGKLASAIMKAFDAMGPVHLSIPIDVMREPYVQPTPRFNLPHLLHKPALLDVDAVNQLYWELLAAKRPVFLLGEEAGGAVDLILTLALMINARIVTTPHGKGLISAYHPSFSGILGFSGHDEARRALFNPEVDRIFVVGANLSEWASNGWDPFLFNQRLIHVESSAANLRRTPMAAMHINGNLGAIFEKILSRYKRDAMESPRAVADRSSGPAKIDQDGPTRNFSLDQELSYRSNATPIKPQRLMRELPRIFPPNTRYLADTGASFSWAIHYLHAYDRRLSGRRDYRGGWFRATLEFASMGWAIGSAIGAAFARPNDPIVCITGDGSMLMSGQEITVAVEHQLTVIFVVLNDSAYGMVKHGQRMTRAEQIGAFLPRVDFAAFARAMGVTAHVIESPQDLLHLDTRQICAQSGPTLLDVRIDPDEAPPIGMRTNTLKQAI